MKSRVKVSRFLSLVLRHKPQEIGLTLTEEGWADTKELLQKLKPRFGTIPMSELEDVVATNEKQRFAFNADKSKIRASQGHSITVDLKLEPQVPPVKLYHGTASHFLDSIFKKGLLPLKRQHVHLSDDLETAKKVGSRHGKVCILELNVAAMVKDEVPFYTSENGVWLCDAVLPKYILFSEDK